MSFAGSGDTGAYNGGQNPLYKSHFAVFPWLAKYDLFVGLSH